MKNTIPCVEKKQILAKGFPEPIRTFSVIDEKDVEDIISITIGDNRLDASVEELNKEQLKKLKDDLCSALDNLENHMR